MKHISGWLALLMLSFWGAMGMVLLLRTLSPAALHNALSIGIPLTILLGLTVLLRQLRRRSRAHCGLDTLEDVRRQSRVRMAGEPDEDAYIVLPSRKGHGAERCAKAEKKTASTDQDTENAKV